MAEHLLYAACISTIIISLLAIWHILAEARDTRLYSQFLDEYGRRVREKDIDREEIIDFMTTDAGSPENWRAHARRWNYNAKGK